MSETRGASAAIPSSGDREIVITRVLDAPREQVFKAWTDPEHLARWWGPNGFTTPVCKMDVRPGGVLHYCMRSPEGHDFWGKGVYREVVEPERIVYTDTFADAEGNPVEPARYGMSSNWPSEAQVTMTLAEHEGKTRLVLRHAVGSALDSERAMCQQGWTESLERLAGYVAKASMPAGARSIGS